jgi:hypothetical protein
MNELKAALVKYAEHTPAFSRTPCFADNHVIASLYVVYLRFVLKACLLIMFYHNWQHAARRFRFKR